MDDNCFGLHLEAADVDPTIPAGIRFAVRDAVDEDEECDFLGEFRHDWDAPDYKTVYVNTRDGTLRLLHEYMEGEDPAWNYDDYGQDPHRIIARDFRTLDRHSYPFWVPEYPYCGDADDLRCIREDYARHCSFGESWHALGLGVEMWAGEHKLAEEWLWGLESDDDGDEPKSTALELARGLWESRQDIANELRSIVSALEAH